MIVSSKIIQEKNNQDSLGLVFIGVQLMMTELLLKILNIHSVLSQVMWNYGQAPDCHLESDVKSDNQWNHLET